VRRDAIVRKRVRVEADGPADRMLMLSRVEPIRDGRHQTPCRLVSRPPSGTARILACRTSSGPTDTRSSRRRGCLRTGQPLRLSRSSYTGADNSGPCRIEGIPASHGKAPDIYYFARETNRTLTCRSGACSCIRRCSVLQDRWSIRMPAGSKQANVLLRTRSEETRAGVLDESVDGLERAVVDLVVWWAAHVAGVPRAAANQG